MVPTQQPGQADFVLQGKGGLRRKDAVQATKCCDWMEQGVSQVGNASGSWFEVNKVAEMIILL